jgi:signal transduction histidine kinase
VTTRRVRVRTRLALLYASVYLGLTGLYIAVNFGIIERFNGDGDSGLLDAISGVLVATAVALPAVWLIAGRALRPIRTITAAAQRISAANLGERIALDGPDDELKELADTIDALLDRLEGSFHREHQFVANASHELRTPLAVTRTALELSRQDPAAAELIDQALRSTARSETLVNDLLLLARSEDLDRGHWETFDLADLAREVTDDLASRAAAAGISVRTKLGPASLTGNAGLIDRLVANLVDNAIRHNATLHNAEDGFVEVRTWQDAESSRLRVTNSCAAVDPASAETLFEPFQRGAGRTGGQQPPGHGLGLSIVRAIAEGHHGEVRATFGDGGSRFEVEAAWLHARTCGVDGR